MNIEEKIRNNREAFDDVKMPEGSRERFAARAGTRRATSEDAARDVRTIRPLWLTFTTIAAAAVAVLIMVFGLKNFENIETKTPQTADNKLVEMRKYYDDKVEEAIINLEDVMENVNDSTKMQINAVIRDLLNMGDIFAEMAPLPEDRQMAITEQIYDNKLRTIELLTNQINK